MLLISLTQLSLQSLMDKMRGYRDGLTDRIPQEHKDKVNDKYDRTKHFLTEEYFPEERRDQFIFRGKKVGLHACGLRVFINVQ